MWRLLDSAHIEVTSEDHGQQFGLPAPLDCLARLRERIVGASVTSVHLRKGTLDLSIGFETGYTLEVIPTSAGYEAWQIGGRNMLAIAVGGGRLHVFRDGEGYRQT